MRRSLLGSVTVRGLAMGLELAGWFGFQQTLPVTASLSRDTSSPLVFPTRHDIASPAMSYVRTPNA